MSDQIGFKGLHGATDIGDVRRTMTTLLTTAGACRPVALFYGRPTCRVMKDVILPDIRYYHFRSKNDVECFCMGYVPFTGEFHAITSDSTNSMFQAEAFSAALDELQEHSAWRYSGQTELVLLNAYRAPETDSARLDFTTVISFCFEKAEKEGAIQSAAEFLETLFNYAFNYEGTNFTYDFSDHLGLRQAASSLKQVWFNLFPAALTQGFQKALNFYIKDFSDKEIAQAAVDFLDKSDEAILKSLPPNVGPRVVKKKHRLLENDG